jgi:hypothetical protein
MDVEEIDDPAVASPIKKVPECPATKTASDEIRFPIPPIQASTVIKRDNDQDEDEDAHERSFTREHPKGNAAILHIGQVKEAGNERDGHKLPKGSHGPGFGGLIQAKGEKGHDVK